MTSDAFLLISYGAPEVKEDVLPFLNKLFSGKKVPPERINAAAEKYYEFARQTGHFSPLNEECRNLISGILQELNRSQSNIPSNIPSLPYGRGSDLVNSHSPLPLYWGNLFWHPLLEDTVAEMARDGVKHAVCFATSAFDSEAGNKRYAEALEKSLRKLTFSSHLLLEKLPLPFEHPLFIEAQVDRLLEAMAWVQLEAGVFDTGEPDYTILFSAHSVPNNDAQKENYVAQLHKTCQTIIEKSNTPALSWELVFQSRSGTADKWLGIDIRDRIREIAAAGQYHSVVVSPIGFFCENMETANDLDLEVGKLCAELNLGFRRAKTIGTSPKIFRMIAELVRKELVF